MQTALLRIAAAAAIGTLLALPAAGAQASGKTDRPYRVVRDLSYDLGSPPVDPRANVLDLYLPRPARPQAERRRPVVVWIHGGGWRKGDKSGGVRKKATLFTRAGYVFASVNYRLSPLDFDPGAPDTSRVMFPAHPADVGEAVAWLSGRIARFGGDRRRLMLVGHSAGAHLAALVATDPRYLRAYGANAAHLRGIVALDAPAFDIARAADPALSQRPPESRTMLWNAFGTPEENARSGAWLQGSPIEFADAHDPPALLVTQRENRRHREEHRRFAQALGETRRALLKVPLDHRQIGRMLGDPEDPTRETIRVLRFAEQVLAAKRSRAKG